MKHSVSAVIITKNEEENLTRCLDNIKWVEEIIIVDDCSTDNTLGICKKYTQHIYQNKFINYALQKRFAFSKARKDWILSLDADEVVPDILKEEITKVLQEDQKDINGYYIPRKNLFLKKWIRYCGWHPDYQLRLFKNDAWQMAEVHVHEAVKVYGNTGYLKEPILHYTYSNIFQYIDRLNRYTALTAMQMIKDGIEIKKEKIKAISIRKAAKTFWKMYINQAGFKDGMRGLILCFFSAVYKLMVYAKYWELVKEDVK